MTRFFDPRTADETPGDKRLYAPATARNRDVILEVLTAHLPRRGTLLEVASGTGEHAAHMAPHLPDIYWQPSDIEAEKINSINAWRQASGAENILPAIALDVLAHDFATLDAPAPLSAVMSANLIHIAPWSVAEALIDKAGRALGTGGVLYLYGPYKRGGVHTAPSNESFDQSLKSRDVAWGVRDLEAVSTLAETAGFDAPVVMEMPANNLSLVFTKTGL